MIARGSVHLKTYLQSNDIELQWSVSIVLLNNVGDQDNLGHRELVYVLECQHAQQWPRVGTCYLLTERMVLNSRGGEFCSSFRGVNLVAGNDFSIGSHDV
jgi:hypothetical protein